MSVDIPKLAVVLGSVAPPQGDVIEARVHLGATKEISSWELLLQNWDKKYSPGGTYPIIVGQDGHIDIGRGVNVPQIITTRTESIKYESGPSENYLRVAGRCWGEKLFRRVVTKTYASQKGEAIVKDLMDSFAGISHNRGGTELIEDTDTTFTLLEYENTPVWDILRAIATASDKAGVIGYDFRVAPDGKFEFFARNSKSSSVSLGEKIEVSEYRKDISRVRNKVTIYGAPDKSVPLDKDSFSDGNNAYLLNDDAEDSHNNTNYQLVGTCIYDPPYNKKIHIKVAELEARVSAGTGNYKITYQKEGGSETSIVTDQAFTNTAYQLKQHVGLDIWGDIGKDVTIRHYTRIDSGANTVYSRNHRATGEEFHGDWNKDQAENTISMDAASKVKGACSIKCITGTAEYGAPALTYPSGYEVNSDLYPLLSFYLALAQYCLDVRVQLIDTGSKIAEKYLDNLNDEKWHKIDLKVGAVNALEWSSVESGFDWTQIKKVRFLGFFAGGTQETRAMWIDNLFFGNRRYSSMQEDTGSQTTYGLRELVDTDEELYSDNECMLRAKAILAQLKDPAEYLTIRSTIIDYGISPLLPADKIHVVLPNENVDADFRILSVEYDVNARTQTLEITLELGREVPLLADYMYALRSKTDHLSRHKISRA